MAATDTDSMAVVELEACINRLLRAQAVRAGELPLAVQRLAEVYGGMIYRRQTLLVLAELAPELRSLLLAPSAAGAEPVDGAATASDAGVGNG